jgi:predicted trehalose synthase
LLLFYKIIPVSHFVYKNDSLRYLYTAEGRTLWYKSDSTKKEFFVKDRLNNVRAVVDVVEHPLSEYLASYEIASAHLENLVFEHHDPIRDPRPIAAPDWQVERNGI